MPLYYYVMDLVRPSPPPVGTMSEVREIFFQCVIPKYIDQISEAKKDIGHDPTDALSPG